VSEKEFLFLRQEMIGTADDWAQGRGHLQADEDENQTPRSQMTAAGFAAKAAHCPHQPEAEEQADQPKEEM
jgi:hypothetical protein